MSITDLMTNEEKLSRVGKKWLPEEDAILLQEITDKKTFDEISLEHKRTITGIKSRIISQILYPKYKNNNLSIDDLSSEYNIEKELVHKYINKLELKSQKTIEEKEEKEENNDIEPKTKRKVLLEKVVSLETKMLIIEQKLDYIISIIT